MTPFTRTQWYSYVLYYVLRHLDSFLFLFSLVMIQLPGTRYLYPGVPDCVFPRVFPLLERERALTQATPHGLIDCNVAAMRPATTDYLRTFTFKCSTVIACRRCTECACRSCTVSSYYNTTEHCTTGTGTTVA